VWSRHRSGEIDMKLIRTSLIALSLSATAAAPALAGGTEECGGHAPAAADKDVIDAAVASKDHTTLVAAVKAAGLVDTLKGKGPFTVFAPTNDAFARLPAGTVDKLLQPSNKATLTAVLTYHVVPGRLDAKTIVDKIAAGGGKAKLTTVQGATLTASLSGKDVVLTDAKGGVSKVLLADLGASNGVIHVIDAVVLPN